MGIFAGIIGLHKGILGWAMVRDSTGDPDWDWGSPWIPGIIIPCETRPDDRNPSRLYLYHTFDGSCGQFFRSREVMNFTSVIICDSI